MFKPADMTVWQGRIDDEEASPALRWHQKVKPWIGDTELGHAPALLGFACDEGVRRNKGRPGARYGPRVIRTALANMAYFRDEPAFDAGDVVCDDQYLEQAQTTLAEHVTAILGKNGFPLVLGGGHEVAWGSFLGIVNYLKDTDSTRRVGVLNFDAHFDLRNPQPQCSSGTPFRQIAHWCATHNRPFHYAVFGLSPTANTSALFEFAKKHQVSWCLDIDCALTRLPEINAELFHFVQRIDDLYLTICLDVFPAGVAPGVSAPATIGVEPGVAIRLIRALKALCAEHHVRLILAEIAEMNPEYDLDGRTAKLAARLVHEIVTTPNERIGQDVGGSRY